MLPYQRGARQSSEGRGQVAIEMALRGHAGAKRDAAIGGCAFTDLDGVVLPPLSRRVDVVFLTFDVAAAGPAARQSRSLRLEDDHHAYLQSRHKGKPKILAQGEGA